MAGLSGTFQMDPRRLTAAAKSAFPASVKVAQGDASARLHNHSKSSVASRLMSETSAALIPKGLATVFEIGREGNYIINAGGDTGLRRSYSRTRGATYSVRSKANGGGLFIGFNSNGGNTGTGVRYGPVIGGPMHPYPALGPAGRDWAMGGYQKVASAKLAASGFGRRI